MTLDFSNDGKFVFDVEEYLDEILAGLTDDMDGVATTPVADHRFKMRDNVLKTNEGQSCSIVLLHRY